MSTSHLVPTVLPLQVQLFAARSLWKLGQYDDSTRLRTRLLDLGFPETCMRILFEQLYAVAPENPELKRHKAKQGKSVKEKPVAEAENEGQTFIDLRYAVSGALVDFSRYPRVQQLLATNLTLHLRIAEDSETPNKLNGMEGLWQMLCSSRKVSCISAASCHSIIILSLAGKGRFRRENRPPSFAFAAKLPYSGHLHAGSMLYSFVGLRFEHHETSSGGRMLRAIFENVRPRWGLCRHVT